MATHDYVIANGTGAAVRADLNNALAAIVSNNSSSSEPATTYAYQWWADTTNNQLKLRNSANNAWITLRELDGTLLMEDGSNSAPGLAFASDLDTGFFRSASNRLNFATGGTERLELGSSEAVFNDPSDDYDFRVESNNSTHMLFVDAGNDRVGIGTSLPSAALEVVQTTDMAVIASTSGTSNAARLEARSGDGTTSGKYAYIRFNNNDTNNQRYDVGTYGTDDLTFRDVKAGSTRMTLDTSGRLLVGTSSARANFYNASNTANILVEGLSSTTSTIAAVSNKINTDPNEEPTFVLGRSGTNSLGSTTIVANNNAVGRVSFQGTDGSDFVELAHIRGLVDGTPGANDMPGRLVLATTADGASSPTERVRIDSSGNVGINTTSPFALLHVKAATNKNLIVQNGGTDTIEVSNYNTGDGYQEVAIGGSVVKFQTGTAGGGSSSERARIDSSGRLLVGTSSSEAFNGISSALQIEGTSDATTRISLFRTQNDSSASVLVFAKARNTSHALLSNNDEIGKIEFYGADGNDTNQRAGMIVCAVDGTPGGNDMPGRLMFMVTADGASTPSEAFNIRQNGEMESDPTYANTTAGAANVHITSGGFFARSTSSEKYKTSIETLEDSYADAILDIRPVWYRSTCQKDNSEHGWWGFIAEEVAAVDPRLVHWKTVEVSHDEEGRAVKTPCDPEPEGVAYDRFVPHLLNLIKRQQSAIETLEAKVAALEAG